MFDDFPCVIGREASDIVYDYRGISGKHARIDFDGKRFLLTDLKSTNGTFVERDGKLQRLEPNVPVPIDDGETAIVSALKLRLFLGTKRSDAELGELIQKHNEIVAKEERKRAIAPRRKKTKPLSGWLLVAIGTGSALVLAATAWMALR
jgi:pSer/pThr/pTyr-binding forkhead associated (FHA) protein